MKKFIFIVVAIVFLIGFPHSAFAFVYYSWSEATDGDLPWSFNHPPILLNPGTNVVTGSMTIVQAQGNDFDLIFFRIPNYSMLTEIKADLSLMPFAGHMDSITYGLAFPNESGHPSSSVRIIEQSVNVPSAGNSLFEPILPILPYDLGFLPSQFGGVDFEGGEYASVAYQVTFEVSQPNIPEPATMFLFGTGLVGFVLKKRRA